MPYKLYSDLKEVPVRLTGRVAVKLHMGEAGNPNHISAGEAGILVDKIRANGGEPFLVDTTTLYNKGRYTVPGYLRIAKKHGFGKFEVVIPKDDDFVEVDGVKIPRPIADSDSLLLLSHVTGHTLTGIGAAIKNLAMGCVVKDTKRWIHSPARPVYHEALCIRCGACVKACKVGCLSMGSKVNMHMRDCPACGACIVCCPVAAMVRPAGSISESFKRFAISAKAVMKSLGKKDILCVNSINNVSERCDCSSPSSLVCRDLGYLADTDPLRIDTISARLMKHNGATLAWKVWERFENTAAAIMK